MPLLVGGVEAFSMPTYKFIWISFQGQEFQEGQEAKTSEPIIHIPNYEYVSRRSPHGIYTGWRGLGSAPVGVVLGTRCELL